MRNSNKPAIIGWGASMPEEIRTNQAPVFDWLKKNQPSGMGLFEGFKDRRVLKPWEKIVDHMVTASKEAIEKAQLKVEDIDLVLGTVIKSEFEMPDELTKMHLELGLPHRCLIIPVTNTANNFTTATLMAHAFISQGMAKNILIAFGTNMTRHVDYHTSQCVSMSDAAAATVMGIAEKKEGCFSVLDHEAYVQSKSYGTFSLAPYSLGIETRYQGQDRSLFTKSLLQLNVQRVTDLFKRFGHQYPAQVAKTVMERQGVRSEEVAYISHQPTPKQYHAWVEEIKPGQVLNSMKEFANMLPATIPVNLAHYYDEIEKDYLLLLSAGPEVQTLAVLLKRN